NSQYTSSKEKRQVAFHKSLCKCETFSRIMRRFAACPLRCCLTTNIAKIRKKVDSRTAYAKTFVIQGTTRLTIDGLPLHGRLGANRTTQWSASTVEVKHTFRQPGHQRRCVKIVHPS